MTLFVVLTVITLLTTGFCSRIVPAMDSTFQSRTRTRRASSDNTHKSIKIDDTRTPPGEGLTRTQARNRRRAMAKRLKTATTVSEVTQKVPQPDQKQTSSEEESDSASSQDSTSGEESSESSESSDSSSSASDSDGPSETPLPTSKAAPPNDTLPLQISPDTLRPFRTYKNLVLESIECTAPGRWQLKVPQVRFDRKDVWRDEETSPAHTLPFDCSPYAASLAPTSLSELTQGQVIRASFLLSDPVTSLPKVVNNGCALVRSAYDASRDEIDVQLSTQFVSLDPVPDPYGSRAPKVDYGFNTITSKQVSDLHVYQDAPKLVQYQSALFEANLEQGVDN